MKKLLKVLAISIFTAGVCTSFTGCLQLLSALLNTDKGAADYSSYYSKEKEQTWNVSETGDVYYIKYNKSSEAVKGAYTGYVTGTKKRSAEAEDFDETTDTPVLSRDENALYNDNEYINKMNEQLAALSSVIAKERGAAVPVTAEVRESNASVGQKKYFNIMVYEYSLTGTVKDQYTERKQGECVKVGKHCNVWFVNDIPKLVTKSDLDFDSLADKFDAIYEKQTAIFGSNQYTSHASNYVDSTNKIQIILCDCMGDAKKGQGSGTFGYQSMADLYTQSYLDTLPAKYGWSRIKSNEDHVIYLDSLFYSYKYQSGDKVPDNNPNGYNAQDTIFSTIPHEFNHLLNNVQKYIIKGTDPMQTWYTEMLSLVTEDLFMDYLGIDEDQSARGRLDYFDKYYNYGFTNWFDGDNVFISYANAFAYGAFLCRNYGGEALLKQIATNNAVNEASITQAISACGYSGVTFEDTIKDFANVIINTSTSGTTLNKAGSTTTSGLKLSPINLNFSRKNGTKTESFKPKIYGKEDMPDLYPSGFSVHKVGSNLKSFTYYKPIKDGKTSIGSDVIIK